MTKVFIFLPMDGRVWEIKISLLAKKYLLTENLKVGETLKTLDTQSTHSVMKVD